MAYEANDYFGYVKKANIHGYIHVHIICTYAYIWGFPGGSAGKESACNAGDLGLIPGLGRSPGEGKGYTLQYFGLENSMDSTVHGVAKSQRQLSYFYTYACIYTCIYIGILGGSDGKESACNAGDPSLIPGSEQSPGGGHGNPFQYSCLENSMDKGACKESDPTVQLTLCFFMHVCICVCMYMCVFMNACVCTPMCIFSSETGSKMEK